jgi:hypothetical protein
MGRIVDPMARAQAGSSAARIAQRHAEITYV